MIKPSPASPARLVISRPPPLHLLRLRVLVTRATDLRLALLFSYHSCYYLQLKNKLLGEAFSVLFFGSCMRMRKGWKKFLGLVLLFLLLSSVDTGFFF